MVGYKRNTLKQPYYEQYITMNQKEGNMVDFYLRHFGNATHCSRHVSECVCSAKLQILEALFSGKHLLPNWVTTKTTRANREFRKRHKNGENIYTNTPYIRCSGPFSFLNDMLLCEHCTLVLVFIQKQIVFCRSAHLTVANFVMPNSCLYNVNSAKSVLHFALYSIAPYRNCWKL